MDMESLPIVTLAEENVGKLFGHPDWFDAARRCTGRPPIWLVEGSLSLDSLSPADGAWILIVHGDLHIAGDVDLTSGDRNVLVVMGTLHVRNLKLGSTHLSVAHDVRIAECLMCAGVMEEAVIDVKGTLAARLAIFGDDVFVHTPTLEALVCTTGTPSLPSSVEVVDPEGLLVDEVLDEGEILEDELWDLTCTGTSVLR